MKEGIKDGSASPVVTWHEHLMPLGEAVCACGLFDGVHLGHQYLIEKTLADAIAHEVKSWIITFDCDPEEILHPDIPCRKLLTNEDRISMLSCTGVDGVLVIPFTRDIARLEPLEFCEAVLKPTLTMLSLHVGVDFRYGAQGQGTVQTLDTWMCVNSGRLVAHGLLHHGEKPVTATCIRELLKQGEVDMANQLLTRPFFLKGTVVAGRGVGRSLGVPTANLKPELPAVTLGEGVYGGYAVVADARYRAAISIGAASTFNVSVPSIEPHLLDFDGDLYGQELCISFLEYLRPMKTFTSVGELRNAIDADVDWIRKNLPL